MNKPKTQENQFRIGRHRDIPAKFVRNNSKDDNRPNIYSNVFSQGGEPIKVSQGDHYFEGTPHTSFHKQTSGDYKREHQRLVQVMSQEVSRYPHLLSGEGVVQPYQPKHLELIDFNDYNSNQVQPYQHGKQYDSNQVVKLPSTASNNLNKFAMRPGPQLKKMMNTQVIRSHNSRLKDIAESDLSSVRRNLEQSKSQLDCHNNAQNSNKVISKNLAPYNFSNQKQVNQKHANQQQWKQLYNIDMAMVPPPGVRISDNSNMVGSLFNGSSVVNSIVIDKDIVHHSGFMSELPQIIHHQSQSQTNPETVSGTKPSATAKKTENLAKMNADLSENLKQVEATTQEMVSPNASVFSPNVPHFSSTNGSNLIPGNFTVMAKTRFQSNNFSRPKMPGAVNRHCLPNHNHSGNSFHDAGDLKSTIERVDLSFDLEASAINMMSNKRDKMWFPGVQFDSIVLTQSKKKPGTIERNNQSNEDVRDLSNFQSELARSKPWIPQPQQKETINTSIVKDQKSPPRSLTQTKSRTQKRFNVPKGTQLAPISQSEHQKQPVRGKGENKSNPVMFRSKELQNEPIVQQKINQSSKGRNSTDSQPKKAMIHLGRIRPSRNHQTAPMTNESQKQSKAKNSNTSKDSRKGTPTPDKKEKGGPYAHKDPTGYLNAQVPVNIKIKAGHRNTAQNFNTETFGKRADSTPRDEKTKSQMKDLFEKSVEKQAKKKSPAAAKQGSKVSGAKKSIIRNGELLQVDQNEVRKSQKRLSSNSPRNQIPKPSPKSPTVAAPAFLRPKPSISPKQSNGALNQQQPRTLSSPKESKEEISLQKPNPIESKSKPNPKAQISPKQVPAPIQKQKPSPKGTTLPKINQSQSRELPKLSPRGDSKPHLEKLQAEKPKQNQKQTPRKPDTQSKAAPQTKAPFQSQPPTQSKAETLTKGVATSQQSTQQQSVGQKSTKKQEGKKQQKQMPKGEKQEKQEKGVKKRQLNQNPTPEPVVVHPAELEEEPINILIQDSQGTPRKKGKKKMPESILKKSTGQTPEPDIRSKRSKEDIRYIMPPDSSLELIEITNQDPSMFHHVDMSSSNPDLRRSVKMETPMPPDEEGPAYERLHNKSGIGEYIDGKESRTKSRVSIVSKEESQERKAQLPSGIGSRHQSNEVVLAKRKVATSRRSGTESGKRNETNSGRSGTESAKRQLMSSPNKSISQKSLGQRNHSPVLGNKSLQQKEQSLQKSSQIVSIYGQSIKQDEQSKKTQNLAKSMNQPIQTKLKTNQTSKSSGQNPPSSKNGKSTTRQTMAQKKQSVMTRRSTNKIQNNVQFRTQQQFQETGVGSEKVLINSQSSKHSIKINKQFKDMACGNSDDRAVTDNDKSLLSKKSKKSMKSQKSQKSSKSKKSKNYIRRSSLDSLCVVEHRDHEVNLEESMTRSEGQGLKRKLRVQETDWMHSDIFRLVQQLLRLDAKNRMVESKLLLEQFLNPKNEEIFTEEEAGYFSSLLRRKALTEIVIDENQRPLLEEMYEKAKQSVLILSDHLNLTIDDFNVTDGHNISVHSIDPNQSIQTKSPRQPIIFRNHKYEEVNIESLIKLLLRIRQLYGAIQELIKILSIICKLKEVTGGQGSTGQIQQLVEKYSTVEEMKQKLEADEEQLLTKSLNRFQTLSRRISRFLLEHKLFRHFVFGNHRYQKTLLGYATEICELLKRRGSKEAKSKYGEAFLSDFLEFNEVECEESEVQNLQDADECNRDEFEMQIDNMFDRSQRSGIDAYRSDMDLRKKHFHFGMLSMRSDSQEDILTMTNKGSHMIKQHAVISDPETNKSILNKHNIGHSFIHKTVQSPITIVQAQGQDLLSNQSNGTFIVGKQQFLDQSVEPSLEPIIKRKNSSKISVVQAENPIQIQDEAEERSDKTVSPIKL